MLRLFLKDSLIYAVPALVSRGLTLFLLPLYTRVLSPADYGSLDLFVVFVSLVNLTVALEISQGVARFYSAEENVVIKVLYASSAFWFTTACYTGLTLALFFFAEPLASLVMGQTDVVNAFKIGVVYLLFNGIFYLIQNQLRWELRSKYHAAASLVMSLVTAGVSVGLSYGLDWGLEGLLIGMAAGSLAGCIPGVWWLRQSFRLQFDWFRLREMLAYSAPLVISGLAVWTGMYVDRLMISQMLSTDDVGLYGIGYRVASIASLATVGFQSALTPLIYTYYREAGTPQKLAQIFRIFFFCACLLFLMLTMFSAEIVRLLTVPSFFGSAELVIFLAPGMLLANMYIFAPGVGIAKKTHLLIWIHMAGAVLNSVLNYTLIPVIGIDGAALGNLLGQATVFGLYMLFSQRFYPVPHQWLPIIFAAFFSGALAWGGAQFIANGIEKWSLNMAAAIVFCLFAIAVGLVRLSELKHGVSLILASLRAARPEQAPRKDKEEL